jgi:hypothetical protein
MESLLVWRKYERLALQLRGCSLPAWLYQASVVHVEVVRPARAACELVQSVADSPEAMHASQESVLEALT